MRSLALALLGGMASGVLVWRSWPGGASDPLAGTIAILPVVCSLLYVSSALFGRPLPSDTGPRLVCAATLAILYIGAGGLGMRWGTELVPRVIVAALYVLLFWQAVVQLLAGADSTQERESRPAVALATLLVACYVGIMPWSTAQRPPDGDEPWYLLLTHSIAYDLDTDLTNNYERGDSLAFMPVAIKPQYKDPVGPNGELYSRHNAALPLVLAPIYRLTGKPGALVAMALLTALLASAIYRLAELYFPARRRESLLAAGLAGLSPPLLLYSHQVWVEVPAALLVTLGWIAARQLGTADPGKRLLLIQLFGSIALLPLLKFRFVPLAAGLALLALVGLPARRRKLVALGFVVFAGLITAILVFNQLTFGSALKHHPLGSLRLYVEAGLTDYFLAPTGLLFDVAFGLFFSSPIWVLLLSAPAIGRRGYRPLLRDGALVGGIYLLLLAPRTGWTGSWSPPVRYGLVLLPFLALLLVPILGLESRRQKWLVGFAGAATACLTLIWLIQPGWTYNFADGRTYLLDSLTLATGFDVARFFPSVVRPRSANLVWIGLALLWAFLAGLRQRSSRSTRTMENWGAATLLMGLAALPVLAARLPISIAEFEDPYVVASGGRLHPARWSPRRVVQRGARVVDPGSSVTLELEPNGRQLVLEIDYLKAPPLEASVLEVLAGDTLLTTVPIPAASGKWSTIELAPVNWPDSSRTLRLRLSEKAHGNLYLDRARLDWR